MRLEWDFSLADKADLSTATLDMHQCTIRCLSGVSSLRWKQSPYYVESAIGMWGWAIISGLRNVSGEAKVK
jgi:hypothetical protein